MKYVIFLIGLVMAFISGYMVEPRMRLALTGISPSENPKAKAEQKVVTIETEVISHTGRLEQLAANPPPPVVIEP